ncbi:sigma-70 family RNA polymerase sigma factor [Candidatus Parcubacteria bacterium]|nr:sigma-70 family RNA polymerase sigma factor [Candidatus Parcubacteria bacterium]
MQKIEDFFGLAKKLAHSRWWLYEILPREDYEQEAFLALVLAWEKFDPARRLKFSTYAYYRIKGALINAERTWQKFHRKTGSWPRFSTYNLNFRFKGMTEADLEPLVDLFEGEWFTVPAKMVFLEGCTVAETAQACGYTKNAVHQACSYWRRKLVKELAS